MFVSANVRLLITLWPPAYSDMVYNLLPIALSMVCIGFGTTLAPIFGGSALLHSRTSTAVLRSSFLASVNEEESK